MDVIDRIVGCQDYPKIFLNNFLFKSYRRACRDEIFAYAKDTEMDDEGLDWRM